jgi:hypothetical protein
VPPPLMEIWSAGQNGAPENGGGDDELLGTGGTNVQGDFNGPGIALSPPLRVGELIYALDRQNRLQGPNVEVHFDGDAAVPLLDWRGLVLLVLSLALIARGRLRRATPAEAAVPEKM